MIVWLLGKVFGRGYRLEYARRTGMYPWSSHDAMKDGGIQFMAQVALQKVNKILIDEAGGE